MEKRLERCAKCHHAKWSTTDCTNCKSLDSTGKPVSARRPLMTMAERLQARAQTARHKFNRDRIVASLAGEFGELAPKVVDSILNGYSPTYIRGLTGCKLVRASELVHTYAPAYFR